MIQTLIILAFVFLSSNAIFAASIEAENFSSEQKEYSLSPEYEALYQRYLESPETFRGDINADFARLNPGSRVPYNISLVIDFALCIKKPEIQKAIEDLTIVGGAIDTNPLNIQIMNHGGGRGGSTVWLDPIVSQDQIRKYGGDIIKLRNNVRSYMMIQYQMLIYAYVFAKAQKREKSFFLSAFPRESHCSGSLVDPVRTWLMAEKEALAMPPEQSIEHKLNTIVTELFQSNAFISAKINDIVQRWLSLKIYKRWLSAGAKPMALEDIESMDLALNAEGINPDDFVKEISTLMEKEAKKRAAELFNSRSSALYKVGGESYQFITVDASLVVECSISRVSEQVSESDVTIKDINCSRDDLPSGKQNLKEYLMEKYTKF